MYQMPNIWHIWHTKHKKPPRCSKSYYFCHMWTVPSQICHYMDSCGISFYYFFIPLSLSSLRQSHPQTPILSSQAPFCLSISHSLFLLAPLPCSALAPPYSPRRWRSPPRSPPSEIRSRGSSRSLSSSPAGSSRLGLGIELLTSSSLARIRLSTQSSRRSSGPIGPRRRSCLGWCPWLLGWFVMGSGGMGVGFWFVGVGFGSWWCSGSVGPWLWLGIDQLKMSFCLQTKTKQETHPKP